MKMYVMREHGHLQYSWNITCCVLRFYVFLMTSCYMPQLSLEMEFTLLPRFVYIAKNKLSPPKQYIRLLSSTHCVYTILHVFYIILILHIRNACSFTLSLSRVSTFPCQIVFVLGTAVKRPARTRKPPHVCKLLHHGDITGDSVCPSVIACESNGGA